MATIDEAINNNAKRIETLTKVARLLGDQIKEQNQKIDSLQEEITKLKEHFKQISKPSISSIPDKKSDLVASSTPQPTLLQKPETIELIKEKPPGVLVTTDSDKQELLRALKVIDDL
ncbi:MAG: hypothetical protein JSU57_01965 [Candidatus Heimdallarchaeota archaeon]|nr:MAG: hypothetical protein JSU57_01965 [Candidatus Heimdallarchaeota archaeon]